MAAAFEVHQLLYHFQFKDEIKGEEHSFVTPASSLGEALRELQENDDVQEWMRGYSLFLLGFGEDDFEQPDTDDDVPEFSKEKVQSSLQLIQKFLDKSATTDELTELMEYISHDSTDEIRDERPFWLFVESVIQ